MYKETSRLSSLVYLFESLISHDESVECIVKFEWLLLVFGIVFVEHKVVLSHICVFVCCVCVQGSSGRELQLNGHVGFDSLPDQLVNKCVSKGFDFNILCIGTYIYRHHLQSFICQLCILCLALLYVYIISSPHPYVHTPTHTPHTRMHMYACR